MPTEHLEANNREPRAWCERRKKRDDPREEQQRTHNDSRGKEYLGNHDRIVASDVSEPRTGIEPVTSSLPRTCSTN